MPGTRCSASATFLSGNLPISSAEMTSETTSERRLASSELRSDWRMPVTTMSSLDASSAA